MDTNPVVPPSLIGAGVATQPQPPQSMIGALRSQGSMPAQAVQAMASPGLAAGSGMLSALAGQPGANPYLAQQAQQAQQQQAQQMQMMQMAQRKQAMDAERAMQQNKALVTIAENLMASPDPAVSQKGAVFFGQVAKKMGVTLDPGIIQALGNKDLTGESLGKVVGLYDQGLSPEKIADVTGLPIQAITRARTVAESDVTRGMLKIPTRLEVKRQAREEKKKDLELVAEQYGLTPKNPQTPFALQYTIDTFGVPFNEATPEQRKEAIEKSRVMAVKIGAPTQLVRNALAEFNPTGDPNDPNVVKSAVNAYRGKRQQEMLERAGQAGQLSAVGRQFSNELGRINQNRDRLRSLEILTSDMDRLIQEGRTLHLTDNPQAINAVQQELAHWTGGTLSPAAQWYRAWDTLDARFATVAQAIEQITGNRLAQTNVQRALGFHPKRTDPYGVQIRVMNELKRATDAARLAMDDDTSRVLRQYQSAAGAAGVPFILGGGHDQGEGNWSAEEEQ
jgi:hypothetical protein